MRCSGPHHLLTAIAAETQENDMNTIAKKLVVGVAVATLALLGAVSPVGASSAEAKTVWCC